MRKMMTMMEKAEIKHEAIKHYPRFKLHGKTVVFKLKPIPEGSAVHEEPTSWIRGALAEVVRYATQHLDPADLVGFTFSSQDFSRGQGWIPFKEAETVNVNDIFEMVSGIYQSNSCGLDTNTFEFGVTSVRMPKGKGRATKYNTFAEECHKRYGIIAIKNTDNLCLPIALVIAIAKVNNDPNFKKICVSQKQQKEKALQLCEEAGVGVVPPEGCGLEELQQFQDYLKDQYKITVFMHGGRGKDIFFEGPALENVKNLNLLYFKNHFNVITSLTAAFSYSYFCQNCHVGSNNKGLHYCKKLCYLCKREGICPREIRKQCSDCNKTFYNENCFQAHKTPGGSFGADKIVCEEIRLCLTCHTDYRSDRSHNCDEMFCRICFRHVPRDHFCFMQVDKRKPVLKNVLYVFFDLETRQEMRKADGSLLHETNLCVFKTACDECINNVEKTKFCYKCGPNLEVLRYDCVENFISLILSKRKLFKQVVVLSHFGSGFDMQFVLNHLLEQTDHTPDVILRGSKILLMTLCNVKFLDSINFMSMALSKLPKAFGLPADKFKKGYFPHLFNKKEHENYVGPLPDVKFYDPDSMAEEDRAIFLQWYEENKHSKFDFQQELVDYCISDVEILMEASLKFRALMLQTSDVCPFTESCTIPGACNKIYRRNFLKENTIAIIPKNGYRMRDNQSRSALTWLVWEEQQRKIDISHTAKRREVVLGGFKVDGFCEATKQVFEFHGCFWHGCPSCFKNARDKPLKEAIDTFDSRHESTIYKTEALKSMGYEVIEKWECDFVKDVKSNVELKNFSHPLLNQAPLNPRDAFYGGRTGNTRTYYSSAENEKIKYLDVCSLYPWVCKYGKFPVGHPQVFVGGSDECSKLNLDETEGLIKCRILPPQTLYHPVLPVKMNNKLMFVLCRSCGEQMTKDECQHTEEDDRALTGTWIIDEVRKAVEKGYRILDIFEIWKYEVEQYDAASKSGGLFVEMMNKFLKIKQEASDWPSSCKTDEQKQKYVDDFFEREGIRLDADKISKNPGLRSLAKLILNSFWGKFGQLERKSKTKIIRESKEFFEMMTDPLVIINSVVPINEDVVLVNYIAREETYEPLQTVNVAIAAYTTAEARLKLYSFLEMLGPRVLYYDTDSIIYSHREGEYEPPTGEFIGDLTDELECYGEGSYIREFASGGPKNYAYKLFAAAQNEEKIVCKVKGIRLNYKASRLVNFHSIKDMILSDIESEPISIVSTNFRRTQAHEVVTREEVKQYRLNSTKRRFDADSYDSVPYGYKKLKS